VYLVPNRAAPKGQNVCTKVEQLIDPVTNTWDEELLEQARGSATNTGYTLAQA
jgi:hypothetical protein